MKNIHNHFFILNKEPNDSCQYQNNNSEINSLKSSFQKNKSPNKEQKIWRKNSEAKDSKRYNGFNNIKLSEDEIIENNDSSFSLEAKNNTGRWTDEEHNNFLKALIEYGNDWKQVQKKVKSRSSSQSRSHAQKYFLKIKNYIEYRNWNEKDLYNFIMNKDTVTAFDYEICKLSDEEKEKIYNVIITNIDLFDKRGKKNKGKNSTNDLYNKYQIKSKSNHNSFHSDEDEDVSEIKDNNKMNDNELINNKRKRTYDEDYKGIKYNMNPSDKIFNVVKCVKYKYSEDFIKNQNEINKFPNIINIQKLKQKFTVNSNNSEVNKNNNNINNNINNTINNITNNNNNIQYQMINNNYIINNNIINITNNYSSNNNIASNIDLNTLNLCNNNINTININNINLINNESNKCFQFMENTDPNLIDINMNFNESAKKMIYDYNMFNDQQKYNEENADEQNDELSSLGKNNKTFFISPL